VLKILLFSFRGFFFILRIRQRGSELRKFNFMINHLVITSDFTNRNKIIRSFSWHIIINAKWYLLRLIDIFRCQLSQFYYFILLLFYYIYGPLVNFAATFNFPLFMLKTFSVQRLACIWVNPLCTKLPCVLPSQIFGGHE
jgi:hypothetical protein